MIIFVEATGSASCGKLLGPVREKAPSEGKTTRSTDGTKQEASQKNKMFGQPLVFV